MYMCVRLCTCVCVFCVHMPCVYFACVYLVLVSVSGVYVHVFCVHVRVHVCGRICVLSLCVFVSTYIYLHVRLHKCETV